MAELLNRPNKSLPSLGLKNQPKNFDWQAIHHTAEVESQDEEETTDYYNAPSGDDYSIDYSGEDTDAEEEEEEMGGEDEEGGEDESSDQDDEARRKSQKNKERAVSMLISFFAPPVIGVLFGSIAKVIMWQHRDD